jgi:4-hydroxy-tetrahydrodipicolinate synthase
MRKSFRGLIAYPITPLTVDGDPHLGRVAGLAAAAAAAGVDGVSVLATSGAGISFGRAERQAVAEAAVQAVGPWRTPVYVAVSAPSTREIVALARDADAAGAAGLLLTPFAYLPLSDEEVRSLFIEVGDASSLPICFYNKPAQMHYDLSADMLHELARSAPIAGVKETSLRDGLTARVQSLRDAGGPDVAVGLSGELALLRDQPAADAWHTGLAALLPVDYTDVWRRHTAGEAQGESLERLRTIALGLAQIPRGIGALHALATLLGTETTPPRGPFAAASPEDVSILSGVVKQP